MKRVMKNLHELASGQFKMTRQVSAFSVDQTKQANSKNNLNTPKSHTLSKTNNLQRAMGNQQLRQVTWTSNRPAMVNRQQASSSSQPVKEERFNLGEGGHRFDATLDRSQRLLTLKMKVKFAFDNSLQPWPSQEFQEKWKSEYINVVENRWSFRYYLDPDQPRPNELLKRVFARIQVIPVTSSPHFTAKILYASTKPTTKKPGPRSSVKKPSANLDVFDTMKRPDIPQVPAEHEFGHMLGLPHVHCNTNKRTCYGVTPDEKANVMGHGSIVSVRDYKVFAAAMYYFTGMNWHPSAK